MSVSAILGSKFVILPKTSLSSSSRNGGCVVPRVSTVGNENGNGMMGLVIECSSRPQKKATAHHRKTRPRKTQPWDVRRGPTVYPPLPTLPPEWTLVEAAVAEVSSPPSELTQTETE